jgi:hypothetical protein
MQGAAAMLEPLAWPPNGGSAFDLARRMMGRAVAGDWAGVLAEGAVMRLRQAEQATAAVIQAR